MSPLEDNRDHRSMTHACACLSKPGVAWKELASGDKGSPLFIALTGFQMKDSWRNIDTVLHFSPPQNIFKTFTGTQTTRLILRRACGRTSNERFWFITFGLRSVQSHCILKTFTTLSAPYSNFIILRIQRRGSCFGHKPRAMENLCF